MMKSWGNKREEEMKVKAMYFEQYGESEVNEILECEETYDDSEFDAEEYDAALLGLSQDDNFDDIPF